MTVRSLFFFLLLLCAGKAASAQEAGIDLLRNLNVGRNTSLDPAFRFISDATTPVSISVPAVIIAAGLIRKDKETTGDGIEAGAAFAFSAVLTTGLKYTINRSRPYEIYPEIENATGETKVTPSFPSGHTSSAFATATSMSLIYPEWYVIVPSYTWASAVAYSRMHLGAHYPGDVLAGALIGTGSAWLCHIINKKLAGNEK